jgi:cytochrome c553
MFHTKNNIVISLALFVLFTAASAFARSENTNPLTGQVGVAPDDDSPAAIKVRSGPGDPVAGREKSLLCQGCHGEEGISIEGLIPKLAGQYGIYIAKELRNYQSGTRSHQIMNAMAATISDDDLADIAAYFASRPKMKGGGSNNELGKKLFFHGDISRTMVACVNCHGVNGKGLTPKTAMFPVIGGQQKDYIRRQLVNFRKGDRTNSPNGIMNRITQKMTDDELEALADFVSGQ